MWNERLDGSVKSLYSNEGSPGLVTGFERRRTRHYRRASSAISRRCLAASQCSTVTPFPYADSASILTASASKLASALKPGCSPQPVYWSVPSSQAAVFSQHTGQCPQARLQSNKVTKDIHYNSRNGMHAPQLANIFTIEMHRSPVAVKQNSLYLRLVLAYFRLLCCRCCC